MTLQISIQTPDGTSRDEEVDVTRAFNFGYAGRSKADVAAHVDELRELGLLAPTTTPSIYPINPQLISTNAEVEVRGADTYGEVEFVLVHGAEGWYVGVASDHSDFVVEQVSTARAKTIYPDVVSRSMWNLSDVTDHWDQLVLRGERQADGQWAVVQEDVVGVLLTPHELIAELESRSGAPAGAGTVFVSGTIAGEILPGATAWRNSLVDPVLDRTLHLEYRVIERPLEL